MVGIHDTIDRLQNKYLSCVEEKERTILTKEENMELVLPQNYVEIEQEEMMYLDGGDAQNFSKNINGDLAYTALYGGRNILWSWNPLNFGVQF